MASSVRRALLSVGTYGIVIWAVIRAPVAALAALRETAVIVAAALAFFAAPALTRMGEAVAAPLPQAPSFTPIAAAYADEVRVPPGDSAHVLYR